MKGKQRKGSLRSSKSSAKQRIHQQMTITIMSIDIFNIRHVKDVNIYDSLSAFFENQVPYQDTKAHKKSKHSQDPEVSSDGFEDFKQKNPWLFPHSKKELLEQVDLKFVINDNCDVCIRIRENPEKQEHAHEHHHRSSLDYRSLKNLKKTLEKEEKHESESNEESDDDHEHDQQTTIYLYEKCNGGSKLSEPR